MDQMMRNVDGTCMDMDRGILQKVFQFPKSTFQSPALNPIENMWVVVKKNVNERKPKMLDELEDILREEWSM